jgi:hypothetical protein
MAKVTKEAVHAYAMSILKDEKKADIIVRIVEKMGGLTK